MRKRIESLNNLTVTEFSCAGGECEYVLVDDTPENELALRLGGFGQRMIDEPAGTMTTVRLTNNLGGRSTYAEVINLGGVVLDKILPEVAG